MWRWALSVSRAAQLAFEVRVLLLGYTSPLVFRWSLATNLRLLAASRLALRARVAIEQYANPPANIANPLLAFVTGAADVQATRRLLLFADVVPWGLVGDLASGDSARAFYGGASLLHARCAAVLRPRLHTTCSRGPAGSCYISGLVRHADLVFWYD